MDDLVLARHSAQSWPMVGSDSGGTEAVLRRLAGRPRGKLARVKMHQLVWSTYRGSEHKRYCKRPKRKRAHEGGSPWFCVPLGMLPKPW